MKTGKKIVAILLCLCTALTCFGYAFAADADETCTHEWIFDSIRTIPEESHEFAVYHCKNCSSVHSVILHVWDAGSVEKEPTCTDDGQMVYVCIVGDCTETKTESIAGLGHKFSETADPDKSVAATCEADGKDVFLCERENCEAENIVVLPKTGHKFSETADPDKSVAATCEADGKKVCFVRIPANLRRDYVFKKFFKKDLKNARTSIII